MTFSPGKSACTRLVGAIVGISAFGLVWTGTAYADTTDDAGAKPNSARQQTEKPSTKPPLARPDNKSAPKVGVTIRDEPSNFAAADDVDLAALARDVHEDITVFASSPAAERAAFNGGAVPTVGMGGLAPNARALAAYIINAYPGVQSIGGVRSDPFPDHPSGHAIDIMIGSDMGLGDAINADVQGQAGRFGVVYTMWRVANHFNHVHVTVS